MHGLIPEQFEGLQYQPEQGLLNWHKTCEQKLHCTVLAPFLDTKIPRIQGVEATGTKFDMWQNVTGYIFPLEYVFSADRKRFLAGKNDGTNLNGFLPFTNDNLLWGLGI